MHAEIEDIHLVKEVNSSTGAIGYHTPVDGKLYIDIKLHHNITMSYIYMHTLR